MKKITPYVFILLFFAQCSSVKKHNEQLTALIPVDKLKSDVDFTYKKLQRLHPNLYWYISKKDLDYKFDSLKSTIAVPLTPLAFYKKLGPLVSAVRQGHTFLYPPEKLLTKKETKALLKKGTGPLSQFDFDFIDDKLYVIKNKSYNKTIKAGTEVVAVNGTKPADLIQEYNLYYSSDGYNSTLKSRSSGRRFSSFFSTQNGIKDSLTYSFKFNDSLKVITIRRLKEDTTKKRVKKIPIKLTAVEKAKSKAIKKKKRVNGYDSVSKNYSRNIRFAENDSSVAVIKIRGFKNGDFRTFYKESFRKIEKNKSKTIVLDLRNNGGGRLSEIVNLYSYLSDSTFVFLDKSEVVSKSSLFEGAYFNGGSFAVKTIKTIFSPLLYSYLFLTVHKDKEGKNSYATQTKHHKVNKNSFKGKIYVLINGVSFSASSIISSNLKGSKRATFVGEETGGAYNGTVAGFMPVIKLPNSDLKIRIGLMKMAAHYKTDIVGRGIFPDVPISPTLQDRIKGNDPEMDWIIKDIKSNKLKNF